jgi:hypothetical protein
MPVERPNEKGQPAALNDSEVGAEGEAPSSTAPVNLARIALVRARAPVAPVVIDGEVGSELAQENTGADSGVVRTLQLNVKVADALRVPPRKLAAPSAPLLEANVSLAVKGGPVVFEGTTFRGKLVAQLAVPADTTQLDVHVDTGTKHRRKVVTLGEGLRLDVEVG